MRETGYEIQHDRAPVLRMTSYYSDWITYVLYGACTQANSAGVMVL